MTVLIVLAALAVAAAGCALTGWYMKHDQEAHERAAELAAAVTYFQALNHELPLALAPFPGEGMVPGETPGQAGQYADETPSPDTPGPAETHHSGAGGQTPAGGAQAASTAAARDAGPGALKLDYDTAPPLARILDDDWDPSPLGDALAPFSAPREWLAEMNGGA